ncbi:MAG: RNA polymerase sigma factor [Phycisphaerae bacterium]|nr:RNA polymerase sigma factor [Phycisphaerae bacterium]
MDADDPGQRTAFDVTSTSLLDGLLDPKNDRIWTEFFERYGPIVRGFARKLRLREHEADDAVQETMVTFVTKYRQGEYDRQKGRLRSWLCGLAYHKIRHLLDRRQQRERQAAAVGGNASVLDSIPDEDRMTEVWEGEWRNAILRRCLDQIRDETDPVRLRAFELYALQGWSPDDVAEELGISRNMVYLSKSRVLTRIAKLRDEMDKAWQEGSLP